MSLILEKIKKTREYLDYVEEHYNNVQKAFDMFLKRVDKVQELYNKDKEKYKDMYCNKYYDVVLYIADDWRYEALRQSVLEHDLSKLSHEEFIPYREHFFNIDNKEKELSTLSFEKAWQHHKETNEHHWQNRTYYHKPIKGQELLWLQEIIHNVLDWVAMAIKFNEPFDGYYNKNKSNMVFKENEKRDIELLLELMCDKELEK